MQPIAQIINVRRFDIVVTSEYRKRRRIVSRGAPIVTPAQDRRINASRITIMEVMWIP